MLEKLLILAKINLKDYVADPKIIKRKRKEVKQIIENTDIAYIEDPWQTASGTCMIFLRINAANQLCSTGNELLFGDSGRHRIIWSEDGIIIDFLSKASNADSK